MKRLESVGFSEALRRAVEAVPVTRRTESVLLDQALGRILAEDVSCRKNLPSFDNSAMDGFAVRSEDVGRRLRIAATIYAGDRPRPMLREGECYRIMTGAQVPEDADTVVPVEDCPEWDENEVLLPSSVKAGANLRKKGEEQRTGSVLMRRGERLDPARIAMLSAQGILAVRVHSPLRIAVLSTGNEIREPWEGADEDEIYNANAFGISALLRRYGFEPEYAGSLPDDLEATKARIAELRSYDVIISSGGISMGEADFLEEAYLANGLEPLFHGVRVKPGRPTMMGRMGESFVMAMPGNPLTAMLNLFLLSLPVLFRMQGSSTPYFPAVRLRNLESFRAKASRANLVLGKMEEGAFRVLRQNRIGSGMLTPLMEADCVAVLEEGYEAPKEGEEIKVILFESWPSAEENGAFNVNGELAGTGHG